MLLGILLFVTTGADPCSGRAHFPCGIGGLIGKAPAGAGGLWDGFNTAGIAAGTFEVLAYA